MNFFATVAIALKALATNKLRSSLTMLGIIIGVAAVIVMIAVGSGARAQVEAQIKSLGSNLMMIFSASPTFTGARAAVGSTFTLSEDDAYAIARELADHVAAAAPVLRGSGQIVAGNANWSTSFYGVTPEYFEVREWSLAEGRFFDSAEINGAAKVAIIGKVRKPGSDPYFRGLCRPPVSACFCDFGICPRFLDGRYTLTRLPCKQGKRVG